MRKNRAFLWLWDTVLFGGSIGRQDWDREPVTYETGLVVGGKVSSYEKRLVTFRIWWNGRIMSNTICRFGHDWGWPREHRTGLVILSEQTCGRCWNHRTTPLGSQQGRIYIDPDERAKENAIFVAIGVRSAPEEK